MATSRGFTEFAKRMSVVSDYFIGNVNRRMRRAAIAADQAIVLGTPVDTGRARANWIVSIGSPDLTTNDNTDPGGDAAIQQGVATINGWKVGRGSIFLSNSLPYIVPLEEGSSAQAPNGMTKFAIQAAETELGRGSLFSAVR